MTKYNRTYDGRPISAGASGWQEYRTDRAANLSKPAAVLSPADVLEQISELRSFLQNSTLEKALKELTAHINNTNNPHGVTLSDFTDEVADALYKEYIKLGGTGSEAAYLQSLFKVLRVANVDELSDPDTYADLLPTIKAVKDFIQRHELSPDAHSGLFAKIFPGTTINEAPIFSISSNIGLPYQLTEGIDNDTSSVENNYKITGVYSYVNRSRVVDYSTDLSDCEVDYVNGEPLIACFGPRINEVTNSTDFSLCGQYGVTLDGSTEIVPCATNEVAATAIVSTTDTSKIQHYITYQNVELTKDVAKTFSVFAKAGACRYLIIGYKDLTALDMRSMCVYDLEEGKTLLVNHFNRYQGNIVTMRDGWFRCEFTMYNPVGQLSDIEITCLPEKTEDIDITFSSGSRSVLMHLWGMQLEEGNNASPYIPTLDGPVYRPARTLTLDLSDIEYDPTAYTLQVNYVNPKVSLTPNSLRPVLTFVNSDVTPALEIFHIADGSMNLYTYAKTTVGELSTSVVTYSDTFNVSATTFNQLVYTMDKSGVYGLLNRESTDSRGVVPVVKDDGNYVLIGNDSHGNYLDGYIRDISIYNIKVSPEQAEFLNGEEIYGN